MANTFSMYARDENLIKNGITVDRGEAGKFIIRRADNPDAKRLFTALSAPLKYQIDRGTIKDEEAYDLMLRVFAETVVIGWSGVCDAEDNEIPYSKENSFKLFKALPDLYEELKAESEDYSNFRIKETEKTVKNCKKSSRGN